MAKVGRACQRLAWDFLAWWVSVEGSGWVAEAASLLRRDEQQATAAQSFVLDELCTDNTPAVPYSAPVLAAHDAMEHGEECTILLLHSLRLAWEVVCTLSGSPRPAAGS